MLNKIKNFFRSEEWNLLGNVIQQVIDTEVNKTFLYDDKTEKA